jgi:hypothetical protein
MGNISIHDLARGKKFPWRTSRIGCWTKLFREDECRVRTGNEALNLNILRKMGLHPLRKNDGKEKKDRFFLWMDD